MAQIDRVDEWGDISYFEPISEQAFNGISDIAQKLNLLIDAHNAPLAAGAAVPAGGRRTRRRRKRRRRSRRKKRTRRRRRKKRKGGNSPLHIRRRLLNLATKWKKWKNERKKHRDAKAKAEAEKQQSAFGAIPKGIN